MNNFPDMSCPPTARPVERLFPFALRAAILVPGREALRRRRKKLLFVLVTTDLSENSRADLLRDFGDLPLVEHYTAADMETFFRLRNTKVLGFKKSALAASIFRELKMFHLVAPRPETRIAQPEMTARPPSQPLEGPAGTASKRREPPADRRVGRGIPAAGPADSLRGRRHRFR